MGSKQLPKAPAETVCQLTDRNPLAHLHRNYYWSQDVSSSGRISLVVQTHSSSSHVTIEEGKIVTCDSHLSH